VDYPEAWPDLLPQLAATFASRDAPASHYFAALLTAKSLVGAFEFVVGEERRQLSSVVLPGLFPQLVGFLGQLAASGSSEASVCGYLRAGLECFEISIQMQFEAYFAGEPLAAWMQLLQAALTLPLPPGLLQKRATPEQLAELDLQLPWKLRRTAYRIAGKYAGVTRLLSYCNASISYRRDAQMQAAVKAVSERHALGFLEAAAAHLAGYPSVEVSPNTLCALLGMLVQALHVSHCAEKLAPHLPALMLDSALPLVRVTAQDEQLWKLDPVQFVYASLAQASGLAGVRHAALQLIKAAARLLGPDHQPQLLLLVRFVAEFVATGKNPRNPAETLSTDTYCALLHVLQTVHDLCEEEPELETYLRPLFDKHLMPLFTASTDSPPSYLQFRLLSLLPMYQSFVDVVLFERHILKYICSPHLAIQFASMVSLADMISMSDMDKLDEQASRVIVEKCMNLCGSVDCDETLKCVEVIISSVSEYLGDSCREVVLQLLSRWWNGKQTSSSSTGQEEDRNPLSEADTCIDGVQTILKSAQMSPAAWEAITEGLLKVLKASVVFKDVFSAEKTVSTLGLVIGKLQRCPEAVFSHVPLVCYMMLGRPNALEPSSAEEASLFAALDWWRLNPLGLESLLGFFGNLVQLGGRPLHALHDAAGIPFSLLFLEVFKACGKLGLENKSSWEVASAVRLVLLLLENPASGAAHFLEDLVVAVLAFFRATDGSHQVVNLSMKFASTLFWRYPLESVSILRRLGEWERVLGLYETQASALGSQYDRRLFVLGVSSLLLHCGADTAGDRLLALVVEVYAGKKPSQHTEEDSEDADDSDYHEEDDAPEDEVYRSPVLDAKVLEVLRAVKQQLPELWQALPEDAQVKGEKIVSGELEAEEGLFEDDADN